MATFPLALNGRIPGTIALATGNGSHEEGLRYRPISMPKAYEFHCNCVPREIWELRPPFLHKKLCRTLPF